MKCYLLVLKQLVTKWMKKLNSACVSVNVCDFSIFFDFVFSRWSESFLHGEILFNVGRLQVNHLQQVLICIVEFFHYDSLSLWLRMLGLHSASIPTIFQSISWENFKSTVWVYCSQILRPTELRHGTFAPFVLRSPFSYLVDMLWSVSFLPLVGCQLGSICFMLVVVSVERGKRLVLSGSGEGHGCCLPVVGIEHLCVVLETILVFQVA